MFCLLTYPLILSFPDRLFGDEGDAVQNVWNLWWTNKAVTELGQSPWHTTFLHYPYGASLIGHSLAPLNGLLALPLLHLMTPFQAYNVLVLVAFVLGGVTAFWLARDAGGAYLSSLLAGYVYTFSSYHFTHATGHLEMATLQWLPLFVLFWHRLLRRPGLGSALGAALSLCACALVTYYHLLYAALIAVLMLLWYVARERGVRFLLGPHARGPLALFAGLALLTTVPLAYTFIRQTATDPVVGAHDAAQNSLDLQALVIPGAHWRFGALTQPLWSQWPSNMNENGVGLGLGLTLLLGLIALRGRDLPGRNLGLWFVLLLCFVVLSLGPVLHAGGVAIVTPMPYAGLEAALPVIRASGMPVRMMVMAVLSGAVAVALGLPALWRRGRAMRILVAVLLAGVFVEDLPLPIPSSAIAVPEYVRVLKDLPGGGGVLYTNYLQFRSASYPLYYQTIHGKPIAFGYLARVAQSTQQQDDALRSVIRNDACGNNLGVLNTTYGFHYFVVPPGIEYPGERVAYRDADVTVYDLEAARATRVLAVAEYVQPEQAIRSGEILPEHVVGQTFKALRDGLDGVGVFMTSFGRPLRGPLVFHLQYARDAGLGPDLVTLHMDMAIVRDDAWFSFMFTPLSASAGQTYYAYLEAPEARAGQALAAGIAARDAYPGGTLMVNHTPAPGDAALYLCYRP